MSLLITANTIRLRRSLGATSRRHRVPRSTHWMPIVRDYSRRLIALVGNAHDALAPLLAELPSIVGQARTERGHYDAAQISVIYLRLDAGASARATQLINRAKDSLKLATHQKDLERLAETYGKKTADLAATNLKRQTKAALGVDVLGNDPHLASRMEGFVGENVSLIKSIPEDLLSDVEKTVYRGISKGISSADLAAQIDDEFEVGEARAMVIARDQIGSFYGQLNAEKQQSVGVTRFIWKTMHDQRVRDEHTAREEASDPAKGGTPYSYDDPPDGELPGEPIQCRCLAEPILSDILDAL